MARSLMLEILLFGSLFVMRWSG